jgi:UDP-glucose 4-epimerase
MSLGEITMSDTEKTILVTGGSGYIGSVTCRLLVENGYNVINLDRVKRDLPGVTQYPFDIDNHQVRGIMQLIRPDAIVHLAADHSVPKSIEFPNSTYANNVANTISLLNHAVGAGVKHVVFSSTSSVYGNTDGTPSKETDPTLPLTPYGRSKLMVEQILEDFSNAYDFTYTSLRYFNAAGSYEGMGYQLDPKEHVVPILVDSAKRNAPFTVNGDDYPTEDGTAKRDYTHVFDVALAHVSALNYLFDGGQSEVINIGGGNSTSIKQLIAEVETQLGRTVNYDVGGRRTGDTAVTSADINKAKEVLGWAPTKGLQDIISSELELSK